ncbi:6662_t:CDS:2, partial [Racocetra persica]
MEHRLKPNLSIRISGPESFCSRITEFTVTAFYQLVELITAQYLIA